MMEILEKTAAALRTASDFKAAVFKTAQEAAAFIAVGHARRRIPLHSAACRPVRQMGLETLLRANGHKVLWHWEAREPPSAPRCFIEAMNAPLYVCSANAVTRGRSDGADRRHRQPRRARCATAPARSMCSSAATRSSPAAMRRRSSASRKSPARSTRAARLHTPCAETGHCNPAQCEESHVPRHRVV